MKWLIGIGAVIIGFNAALAQAPEARVPDHYVVQLRPGAQAGAVVGRHGLAPTYVYGRAINGFAGFIPPGRVAALAADPDVASVEPDYVVVAIGKGDKGTAGKPGGGGTSTPPPQVVPAGVQRVGPAGVHRGAQIGVAIVDTGVDLNHADLISNLASISFNAFKPELPGLDDNGHGTHVAGTVAAADNSIDVVGVAPDATLYAVKVLNSRGSGSDSTIIAGLEWVADRAAAIGVVNMSLGRAASQNDSAMYNAIQSLVSANITVVAAAGNDCGREISQMVPAGFDNVLAVASATAQEGVNQGFGGYPGNIAGDTASYFTTDGGGVIVSAPGEDQENIAKSGFLKSIGILSTKLGGGTTRMSGTSMASPHVAGAVARLLGRSSSLTPEDVKAIIASSSDQPGVAPRNGVTSCYSFDGIREGILSAANIDLIPLP